MTIDQLADLVGADIEAGGRPGVGPDVGAGGGVGRGTRTGGRCPCAIAAGACGTSVAGTTAIAIAAIAGAIAAVAAVAAGAGPIIAGIAERDGRRVVAAEGHEAVGAAQQAAARDAVIADEVDPGGGVVVVLEVYVADDIGVPKVEEDVLVARGPGQAQHPAGAAEVEQIARLADAAGRGQVEVDDRVGLVIARKIEQIAVAEIEQLATAAPAEIEQGSGTGTRRIAQVEIDRGVGIVRATAVAATENAAAAAAQKIVRLYRHGRTGVIAAAELNERFVSSKVDRHGGSRRHGQGCCQEGDR